MTADLSRLVAVIPVGSLSGGKSRLGEPLDAEEREALVAAFLRQAIDAVRASRCLGAPLVVSPDPAVLELAAASGAATLRQKSAGLNEGLAEARERLRGEASALLVLPADLPDLSGAELDRLISRAEQAAGDGVTDRPLVVLVPDRHERGTNALLVAPPDAVEFRFGEDSRALHAAAASAAGARYVELGGPLSLDVDTPEDLLLADRGGLDHASGR